MPENQNVEYKQSWRDEYLKWICGFANAQGGQIFIGIDDKGEIVGIQDAKKLLEDIPNKVVNHLGILVDVNLYIKDDKEYLEIVVPTSPMPISYHGAYHTRTGSTKQELKGVALNEFLLKKIGRTWDDIEIPNFTIKDIDEGAVKSFLESAIKSGRIYDEAGKDPMLNLFEKLHLITPEGKFKAAAVLLFAKDPLRFFVSAYFKIGKFGKTDDELIFQDTIEGNIFSMVESVMTLLKQRYLIPTISYEGIQRIERPEYPEAALREAVLNAIVHKDYTDSTIQLSIYEDKMVLWNPGKLSEDLTLEKLKQKHPSRPRNKNIAEVFYRAGYIESWGRGIEKMISVLKANGYPEPVFEENGGGFQVTFLKDSYTENFLKSLDLNERQISAVIYLKTHDSLSAVEYQELNSIGKTTATRELQHILTQNIIEKIGTGRTTKYKLKK